MIQTTDGNIITSAVESGQTITLTGIRRRDNNKSKMRVEQDKLQISKKI